MSIETIDKTFSQVFSSGWVADELDIIWHAGEPLVLPVSYYQAAFAAIERLRPAPISVGHLFQTNATLINDDWCEFFKTHEIMLGVSIDGPESIHDQQRVTKTGKPTYAQVIKGIRCLQRNEVDFTVISVLTKASLTQARQMHDFYVTEHIRNVCFNIEEVEGSNSTSSLAGDETTTQQFECFMRELWNLNVQSQGLYYIREFKHMFGKIICPSEHASIVNTTTEPFQHLNVDCDGNYSTFSPEFLGHKNERYHDFIIGNVWKNTLAESLSSEAYRRLSADVAAGVNLCRSECEYFSICGGGSPVNKLYENGSIVSTETMYCRLNIKVMARLTMEIIDNSAGVVEALDSSHAVRGVDSAVTV